MSDAVVLVRSKVHPVTHRARGEDVGYSEGCDEWFETVLPLSGCIDLTTYREGTVHIDGGHGLGYTEEAEITGFFIYSEAEIACSLCVDGCHRACCGPCAEVAGFLRGDRFAQLQRKVRLHGSDVRLRPVPARSPEIGSLTSAIVKRFVPAVIFDDRVDLLFHAITAQVGIDDAGARIYLVHRQACDGEEDEGYQQNTMATLYAKEFSNRPIPTI